MVQQEMQQQQQEQGSGGNNNNNNEELTLEERQRRSDQYAAQQERLTQQREHQQRLAQLEAEKPLRAQQRKEEMAKADELVRKSLQPKTEAELAAMREHRKRIEEAAAWTEAAREHQAEGHRAFTGAGYQEQYRRVQRKLHPDKPPDEGIGGKSSFFETLSKAIFGPGTD